MAKRVFLGGTCNDSTWRDELIPLLKLDFFNPVADGWDDATFQREEREKDQDDFCLYCITPKFEGVYSIAEVVDDSNKQPEKTLMCILPEDGGARFTEHQVESLQKVGDMVARNGARVFASLQEVAEFLNAQ